MIKPMQCKLAEYLCFGGDLPPLSYKNSNVQGPAPGRVLVKVSFSGRLASSLPKEFIPSL